MRWWKVAVALALLAALAAWVWLVEIRGERSRKAEEESSARLLGVTAASIREIRWTGPVGEIGLRRRGDGSGWDLVAPVEAPADPRAIEPLTWAIEDARVERVIGSSVDPATYGLEPPVYRLTVLDSGGQKKTVDLGDPAPVGGTVYARVPGGPVVLATSSLRSNLETDVLELRDRRVLRIEPDSILGLRIERSDGIRPIDLERREGGDWVIREPLAADADDLEVEKIRENLERWKADLVPAERVEDPARYGFSVPFLRLLVRLRDGSVTALLIGGTVPAAELPEALRTVPMGGATGPAPPAFAWKLYAAAEKDGAPVGPLLVVDGDLVRRLRWPLYKFREIRATRINRWRCDRVLLEARDFRLELTKNPENTWTVREPAVLSLESADADPLLDGIFDLKIRQFLDHPDQGPDIGPGSARLAVTVAETASGLEDGFRVGGTTEDRLMAFYASGGGQRGLVVQEEAAALLEAARSLHRRASAAGGTGPPPPLPAPSGTTP